MRSDVIPLNQPPRSSLQIYALQLGLNLLFFLGLHHVQDGIDCTYDPLGAFIAGKPVILRTQALHVAGFEKPKNVADELWPDVALGTETSRTND